MAVSISDAWNESPFFVEDAPPTPVEQQKVEHEPVSAKQMSIAASPTSSVQFVEHIETEKDESLHTEERKVTFSHILSELQEMRREEAKRATAYLIVAGLLFAILFYYIEKVSIRTRRLDQTLLHTHMKQSCENPSVHYIQRGSRDSW